MRVHLIKKITIEAFIRMHLDSKSSLRLWMTTIKNAQWKSPGDIKRYFNSADLLGNGSDRVVFNIKGNSYRMICYYKFAKSMIHLYICWLGSHSEYDKLCALNEQYTIVWKN
jgi:mRNA interferase HigB